MASLVSNFVGIRSPNPFWLASAPPTDKEYNVVRAFNAGWGGVVWKTLGEDPPVVNVSSRYGAFSYNGTRVAGFNNIELITDRPLEVNLQEIKSVKQRFPDRAMVVSLMVPCEEESWKRILRRVEEAGIAALEVRDAKAIVGKGVEAVGLRRLRRNLGRVSLGEGVGRIEVWNRGRRRRQAVQRVGDSGEQDGERLIGIVGSCLHGPGT